jgi:pimeloyl-ACP methyl ester carboxylesterase
MSEADERHVHRENLKILMIGDPDAADDLAVSLQIDNVRRARFKSGTIPVSDVLRQALPKITARIAAIWGSRDAFGGIEARRAVLAAVQPDLRFRVIPGAGHWTPYEAADEVNAALPHLLA